LLVVALAIASGALGFGFHYWQRNGQTPPPGLAADFDLPDLAGKRHRLSAYRGKVVLVNFWATWCPPCRAEIPGFIRLRDRLGSKGFEILGIAVDNPEAVARFWQEMKINYPILLADESSFHLSQAYGNPSGNLPYSALVDTNGQIVATRLGIFRESDLEAKVLAILPKDPG